MTKILIGMLSLALVGTGGLVAAVEGFGGSDPLPTVSLPAASTDSTTTGETTTETTTTVATTTAGTTTGTTTGEDEDISGPCDEAEHANDPRCTGAATVDDDRDDDRGHDDDRDDDRSGPGHGDDDDHDDDSGGDEDNSGRGSHDD